MAGPPKESSRQSRRWGRGVPVGAITLLALGILLLLQTTEVVSWEIWFDLWRFWPVIIIAHGVKLLAGRRVPWLTWLVVIGMLAGSVGIAIALTEADNESAALADTLTTFTEPVGDLRSVDVSVAFGAGELTLTSLPVGSPDLVDARFQGREADATLARSGDTGRLEISMDSRRFLRRLFSDVEWHIALARALRLSLELNGGAANITLDLRELQVTDLDVDIGAAETDIIMPSGAGHVIADISAGAADIDVIIPLGVAAMITSSSGLTSLDVDKERFPKSGDIYVSPDFDAAEHRVTLHIRAGASSFSVR